jgi:rod shape-determining protein MreD
MLQLSFLPALRPLGVVPNLVLMVISAAALSGPLETAMILGLSCGFLLDLVSGSDFGLQTGLLALAVLLSAYVSRSGLQFGIRIQLLIVIFAVSSVMAIIAVLGLVISGGRVQIGEAVLRSIILLGANCLIGVILGPICAKLAIQNELYGR